MCNVFLFFLSLYFLVFGVYVSAFYLFRMYLKHRNLCYTHKNLVHAYRMNVRRSIQVLCTQNFVRIPIQATFLTSETFNLQFESLAFHSITQNRCVCVCVRFFSLLLSHSKLAHIAYVHIVSEDRAAIYKARLLLLRLLFSLLSDTPFSGRHLDLFNAIHYIMSFFSNTHAHLITP